MKQICLTLILFLGLIFTSIAQTPSTDEVKIPPEADQLVNPIQDDVKATTQGARIYKKVCWACHGDNGDGKGPQAVELKTKPADFNSDLVLNRTDGALYWWIANGGNDMQPYRDVLTPNDIWKTVNYVRETQTTN